MQGESIPEHRKGRALVIHGQFGDFGGAELFSFRVIAILQNRFDEVVVFHAYEPPPFDVVQQRCGVRLDPERVKFVRIALPRSLDLITGGRSDSCALLQYAVVVRAAQRAAPNFDLVASTFAECPIRPERMIQNIHIPMFVSDREGLHYCGMDLSRGRRFLHGLYIWVIRRLTGGSIKRLARQYTVTNSAWTADQYRRIYPGANVRFEYQGVHIGSEEGMPASVPFEKRENRFIMVGRIVPAKRVARAIEIIDALRAKGHDVGLSIVGSGPADYVAQIETTTKTKPWVSLHLDLGRNELEALIMNHKWGIHCYEFEHYGLAPAELQAFGCITFVHDSGGQREIIINPHQRYSDVPDAVSKIDSMLRSPQMQARALELAGEAIATHRDAAFVVHYERLIDEVMADRDDVLSRHVPK